MSELSLRAPKDNLVRAKLKPQYSSLSVNTKSSNMSCAGEQISREAHSCRYAEKALNFLIYID